MLYNIGVGGNQNLADTSHVNYVISIFITIEKKKNLREAIFVGWNWVLVEFCFLQNSTTRFILWHLYWGTWMEITN